MTDTNKLEIEKEALIIYADRLKMQVFEKQFEIDKAYKVIEEVQEQRERVLEQSNGYLDKIQELNIKNDQLEADLTSLHETLEKTESELANLQSKNLFLMNFVPEDCDCKMKGECRLCPKYTGEKQ